MTHSRDIRPKLRALETVVVPDKHYGRALMLRDTEGITDQVAVIPAPLVPVLALFDGRRTTAEIVEAVAADGRGGSVPPEVVERIVSDLDHAFLLDSPRFRAHRDRIHQAFARAEARPAAHAGSAYHEDATQLRQFIDSECLAKASFIDGESEGSVGEGAAATPGAGCESVSGDEGTATQGATLESLVAGGSVRPQGRAARAVDVGTRGPGAGPTLAPRGTGGAGTAKLGVNRGARPGAPNEGKEHTGLDGHGATSARAGHSHRARAPNGDTTGESSGNSTGESSGNSGGDSTGDSNGDSTGDSKRNSGRDARHSAGPSVRAGHARGPLVGLIAPHIDPWRGKKNYGYAYRFLEQSLSPEVDTFVILGTSHAPMRQPFALCRKPFETPLGLVPVDGGAIDAIADGLSFDPYSDLFNHKREHSVEFQVVFIKHMLGNRPMRIVPILCGLTQDVMVDQDPGTNESVDAFLKAARQVIEKNRKRTLIVAGADLAHVGPRFGDPKPYDVVARRTLERADRESLAFATRCAPTEFFAHVASDLDTRRVCGLAPIYSLLRLLPRGAHGSVAAYEQTVDPEEGSIVSHAAVAFFAAK